MSLAAWNKRVHCIHSWSVYSFSLEVLSQVLQADVEEVSVLEGVPLRTVPLKSRCASEQNDATLYLVNNTLSTCSLCAPGLFGADIVLEKLSLDFLERPIYCIGIPKTSRVTPEQIRALNEHFAPFQLDLCSTDLEDALAFYDEYIKRESENAKVVYEFLSCHPKVGYISYIGSREHKDYSVSSSTLRGGFGGIIDFMLEDTSPKNVLSFLDTISSKGMNVEFLSVDQDDCPLQTLIRLVCTSGNPLHELECVEYALSQLHTGK